jgi:hypothetical protein
MNEIKSQDADPYGERFHYFASSVAEWIADTDLEWIINHFKRAGFGFTILRIKLPAEAGYQIRNYKPVVPDEKIELVGIWE